jgi:hypothetical protein
MKLFSLIATSLAIVGGVVFSVSGDGSFTDMALFFALCFGPLFITLIIGIIAKSKMAHLALLLSTVGYAAWFLFMYHKIISTPDAQSAIGFMFVGALASPFLTLIWTASIILETVNRRRSNQI